jgi:hypothetical protein
MNINESPTSKNVFPTSGKSQEELDTKQEEMETKQGTPDVLELQVEEDLEEGEDRFGEVLKEYLEHKMINERKNRVLNAQKRIANKYNPRTEVEYSDFRFSGNEEDILPRFYKNRY